MVVIVSLILSPGIQLSFLVGLNGFLTKSGFSRATMVYRLFVLYFTYPSQVTVALHL